MKGINVCLSHLLILSRTEKIIEVSLSLSHHHRLLQHTVSDSQREKRDHLTCTKLRADLSQQLFTECLSLAGEENPGLAREAIAIAIWYLRTVLRRKNMYRGIDKKVVGFQHWHSLLEKEMKASLDLLRTLVEKYYSPELPSTHAKDRFIQQLFIVSLKLAGQKEDPVVAKEAATIALHFLTENDTVYWKCWRYVSQKNPHASVFLLQTLVHQWTNNDHSLKKQLSTDSRKQFIQQLFMVSLTLLAGEGIPVVVDKDARKIAIWCLMESVYCWRHWDNLYNKTNIKVGVALLNTLVVEWKDHSLKLPSSPSDIVILRHTVKSFRLKNEKAITERGEEASLFKEADKYCKVISRKLSSHQGTSCAITAAVLFTAPTTAALVLFYLSVFGYFK